MMKATARSTRVALVWCAMVGCALAGAQSVAAEPKKKVDPAADRLLKQMTDFLADLQSFTVTGFSVDEHKLETGEKIQRTADQEIAVRRPDRLRTKQVGEGQGLGLWYDGKTMTIACKANNTYTTLPGPATLDDAIDTLRKKFKVEAPGADLLYTHVYDVLMEQVKSGRVIGQETIGGQPVNHLAFVGDEVDWQIWIKDGAEPVPLRFVITTKTVKDRPEFSVLFSNWHTQATFANSTFEFQPPDGATAVDSVKASCGADR